MGSRPVVSVSNTISRMRSLQFSAIGESLRRAGMLSNRAQDLPHLRARVLERRARYPPRNAPARASRRRASAAPAVASSRSAVMPAAPARARAAHRPAPTPPPRRRRGSRRRSRTAAGCRAPRCGAPRAVASSTKRSVAAPHQRMHDGLQPLERRRIAEQLAGRALRGRPCRPRVDARKRRLDRARPPRLRRAGARRRRRRAPARRPRRTIRAVVDLPMPIEPVRPRMNILSLPRRGRVAVRRTAGWGLMPPQAIPLEKI